MTSYDAIVVGAGIAGLSVARELAKLKLRVLVIEKEEPGGKTSRAAAGILDPYTEASEESPMLELGLKAFRLYPEFLDELGKGAAREVEYERTGCLYLALNPEDEDFLKERFNWQKRRGLSVESLPAGEVRKLEPEVSARVRGGVLYPEVPKLNAAKLTSLLFRDVRAKGVEIRTQVREISVSIEKERIRGVETSVGFLEAPAVVLAAGAWTEVDPKLGPRVKLGPVRGQILILQGKPSTQPKRILHSTRYAYIVPWPGNRLLLGSTLEQVGFDDRVTPEVQKDILERASEMIDSLGELPIEMSWAGLRPYAEGGKPVIGPTRIRGCFLATGYYRSGILIGPLVGKLLAEGIESGNFSPLLKPFYPT